MVADQDVHAAAGSGRLAFEAHEQVHGVARVRPAVEQVTDDHEARDAARPRAVRVDDTGIFERAQHRGIGAVHVGQRDDALDAILPPVFLGGEPRTQESTAGQRRGTCRVLRPAAGPV